MNNNSDKESIKSPNNPNQDKQPESGAINRKEEMDIRQSSPTNPRVNDKPLANQEES